MKYIKEIFKYLMVFLIIVIVATTLLTLVAKIPRKYVEKNLKHAAIEYFKGINTEFRVMEEEDKDYSYIHLYGEEMLFNIIWCLDTNKPLDSVLEARYYERFENEGGNIKFYNLVQEDLEPNAEYMRYWHGPMIVIKPLLMFFTIDQINILNGVLFYVLTIIFLIILLRNKYYAIAISYIIAFIFAACWYVPYSFEYVFAFHIMLSTSIIAILIEHKRKEKRNKNLYMLFWITGILTSLFDFLSAEILTILIPVLIVLSMRIKNGEIKFIKKEFGFIFKSFALWGFGYCLMFVAKWALTAIVLNINSLEYVVDKVMVRVNGQVLNYTTPELIWYAVTRNFTTLYFVNWIKDKVAILISIPFIILVALIMIIDKKDKTKLKYMCLMSIIAVVPYIRYIVLANHSVRHIFMTFRCQMATIMSIILMFTYCSNKKKLFSQVGKRKDNL